LYKRRFEAKRILYLSRPWHIVLEGKFTARRQIAVLGEAGAENFTPAVADAARTANYAD
jgi:hypothetical protein